MAGGGGVSWVRVRSELSLQATKVQRLLTLRHRDVSIRLEHHHRDGLAGQHEADDELGDDAGRCVLVYGLSRGEDEGRWQKGRSAGRRTVDGRRMVDGRRTIS